MSRRGQGGVDQIDADARFIDRAGHEVGRVRLGGPIFYERIGPGRWRQYTDETDLPSPFRFTCPLCPGQDLRASRERVVSELRRTQANRKRRIVKINVG